MTDGKRLYHPALIEETEDLVCLIFDPVTDAIPLPVQNARPLHAVLCEAMNSTQALLRRLEDGVSVPTRGREPIRELYARARALRDALAACLELDGLE